MAVFWTLPRFDKSTEMECIMVGIGYIVKSWISTKKMYPYYLNSFKNSVEMNKLRNLDKAIRAVTIMNDADRLAELQVFETFLYFLIT